MIAYQCLECGTVHGWGDHPNVVKVKRHVRNPGEDIWWCPKCNREHRTFDGTWFGQPEKRWKEVDPNDPPAFDLMDAWRRPMPWFYKDKVREATRTTGGSIGGRRVKRR